MFRGGGWFFAEMGPAAGLLASCAQCFIFTAAGLRFFNFRAFARFWLKPITNDGPFVRHLPFVSLRLALITAIGSCILFVAIRGLVEIDKIALGSSFFSYAAG